MDYESFSHAGVHTVIVGSVGAVVSISGGAAFGAAAAGATAGLLSVVLAAPRTTKAGSAAAGAFTGAAAILFAANYVGGTAPKLPEAESHVVTAPVTTVIAEGGCNGAQMQYTGDNGQRVEVILPPGCSLKP